MYIRNKIKPALSYLVCISATAILLSSCSSGTSSSSSTPPASGQLTFTPSGTIQVTKGSLRHVLFSLQDSTGVNSQVVNFTSSNPAIATVTPASCTVSSGTEEQSSCVLKIQGLQNGSVSISAASNGYPTTTISGQVGESVVYGRIHIFGQGESASYTALYPSLESAPHKITFTAVLESSSGVMASNPLYVNLAESPASCSGSGCTLGFVSGVDIQQCALSTEQPTCNIQATLYSNTNVSTSLNPVGSLNTNYSAIPVNVVGTTDPESGAITLSTQHNATSNNTIFSGLNAPIFVNWKGFNGVAESLTLTITSNSSNLQFYQYNPGAATTTSQTTTCVISNTVPNCGLNVIASQNGSYQVQVSSITVNAGSTTNSIPSLKNSPFTLNVVSPSTTGRTITFTNNSKDKVQLGFTSGSAMSFINPLQSTTGGSFDERSAPGAGSMCGPSNPQAACPIGTTCAQGGANPSKSSTYFCFWSPLSVATGSKQLESGTSATVFISNSNGVTTGTQQIQWSGNYHADKCPAGVCPPSESGVGTGPTYPAVTLAEVTYQYSSVDYYDVSIINGVNYALTFGPTSTPVNSSDAYSCGQAGSFLAQNGGWSYTNQNSAGLPASNWVFTPTESSIVGGISQSDTPASYFAVVESAGINYGTCNTNGTGCNAGATCGWEYSQVATGTYTFESSQRICGKFVSWATANQIFGWNESITNLSPFNLLTSYAVSPAYQGVSSILVGNYQLCNNNTYSAYGNPPTNPDGSTVTSVMACGGVNWNNVNNQNYGITRPSGPAVTVNNDWMNQVLPTITWLKQACPTCYTFPYDDFASTFTCSNATGGSQNSTNYTITINNLGSGTPEPALH